MHKRFAYDLHAENALNEQAFSVARARFGTNTELQDRMLYQAILLYLAASTASDKQESQLTLTGAQLLEAFEFIAPDRDAEQMEQEVTIAVGDGHDGHGTYCCITDYPDEGAILLDGKSAEGIITERTDLDKSAESDKQEAVALEYKLNEFASLQRWFGANGYEGPNAKYQIEQSNRLHAEILAAPLAQSASDAQPFGWVQPKGGNYFTRSEVTAQRIGDLVPVYLAAPRAAAQDDGAERFACYLVDHCEREMVSEESILRWLGKMLADPQYAAKETK